MSACLPKCLGTQAGTQRRSLNFFHFQECLWLGGTTYRLDLQEVAENARHRLKSQPAPMLHKAGGDVFENAKPFPEGTLSTKLSLRDGRVS